MPWQSHRLLTKTILVTSEGLAFSLFENFEFISSKLDF